MNRYPVPLEVVEATENQKNGVKVEKICSHIDSTIQVSKISFFSFLTLSLSLTLALSGYCTVFFEK